MSLMLNATKKSGTPRTIGKSSPSVIAQTSPLRNISPGKSLSAFSTSCKPTEETIESSSAK
jgi:hypothetical protein